MRSKPSINSEEGFTLIEIMIALIILSVGLVALAGLQISAIRGNAYSKKMTTAVIIANARLEQIKNTLYADIQSESATQVVVPNKPNEPNMNFIRQVTVTNNSPVQNIKRVDVTVTWKDGSKSHTVPISTIISQ